MESTNFMKFSVNRPGTKVSSSSTPEVVLLPTFNKLGVNPVATKKLGWEHGDYVTIITNDNAEDMNSLYFITDGIDGNRSQLSSVGGTKGVGRSLTFNYSGVYSRILQGKVDAVESSPDGLVQLGLVQKRQTEGGKTAYTALKKVHFEIGDAIEVEINGVDKEIYPLINPRFEDYNPRAAEGAEEEADDQE